MSQAQRRERDCMSQLPIVGDVAEACRLCRRQQGRRGDPRGCEARTGGQGEEGGQEAPRADQEGARRDAGGCIHAEVGVGV